MTTMNRAAKIVALISMASLMVSALGCAAGHVAISKRSLKVQTKMSDTIFLEPVEPEQQTIYVKIRNTTDKDFDLQGAVQYALQRKGFQVTRSPKKARFRLQANVLSVEEASPSAAEAAVNAGYGGAATGAALGYAMTDNSSSYREHRKNAAIGGILGMAAETALNASVKDVTFMVVTDIQLVEKVPNGAYVRTDTQIDNKQGTTGRSTSRVSVITEDLKYRTRIVSTANKANLQFDEAQPKLAMGIAKSLSGLF